LSTFVIGSLLFILVISLNIDVTCGFLGELDTLRIRTAQLQGEGHCINIFGSFTVTSGLTDAVRHLYFNSLFDFATLERDGLHFDRHEVFVLFGTFLAWHAFDVVHSVKDAGSCSVSAILALNVNVGGLVFAVHIDLSFSKANVSRFIFIKDSNGALSVISGETRLINFV